MIGGKTASAQKAGFLLRCIRMAVECFRAAFRMSGGMAGAEKKQRPSMPECRAAFKAIIPGESS